MKIFQRDNATISYSISGKGEITLLFIHGSYIDQTWWNEQIHYFANRYTIVTLDLAGHGGSGRERKEWTIKGLADDVVALVKHEKLQNVITIAHSLGSEVGLIAITSFPGPFIGFIAIDNFKNAGKPLPPEFEKQVEQILKDLRANFSDTNEQYARMALMTPATPKGVLDRVIHAYRTAFKPMGIPITIEVFQSCQTEAKLLPKLGIKLHLINVDYIPTNELALKELLGVNFDLRIMHGTSHFPMIEDVATFNGLLEKTIEEISSDTKMLHHFMYPVPN